MDTSRLDLLIAFRPIVGFLMLAGVVGAQVQPAADAPQPLSPRDSAACVQLPAGFRMQLIASEPIVEEPSCVAFDEFGRTFVCELHGYNVEGEIDVAKLNTTGKLDKSVRRIRWELKGGEIAEQAAARQYGKLKLLVDDDGDGVMDRAEVWADDLPACYGIVPARGGILVTCAPDIVFFADTDQDGKPDVREVLFTGFRKEVLERGINNPRWGVDNWIYVGSGGSGGTITGPRLANEVKLGSSDFRIKPDGSAIESVHGSVGTFGMTINDFGDRFPASGGQPANYALPLPRQSLERNPHVATPRSTHSAANYNQGNRISEPHPWRVQRRRDPEWVKFYGARETDSSYFSGGCSNEYYGDSLFPKEYHGALFYCEPSLNIVHRCVLSRDGLRYKARRAPGHEASEFLASTDQWFRPMNLRVGPDGALYIVDMYREIIEDYSAIPRFLQQQYGLDKGREHGRLWRLAPAKSKVAALPRLSDLSLGQLVRELESKFAWRRRTAQRLLIERTGPATSESNRWAVDRALGKLLESSDDGLSVVHALHTLNGIGRLRAEHLQATIGHQDERVRKQAIRLSQNWLAKLSYLVDVVANQSKDESAVVRAEVALALGATKSPYAVDLLVELAKSHDGDSWMAAAILSSANDMAGEILKKLIIDKATTETQPLLRPLAATVGGEADVLGMLWLLNRLPLEGEPVQLAILNGLNDGLSTDSLINAEQWTSLSDLLKGESSAATQQLTTQVALKLKLEQNPIIQQRFDDYAKLACDDDRSIADRQAAMEMLVGSGYERIADVARHGLQFSQPPALQQSCVELLDATQQPGIGAVLLEKWTSYTPELRKATMGAIFSRPDRLPALLKTIKQGDIRPLDLSPTEQEQLLHQLDSGDAAFVRGLLEHAEPGLATRLAKYAAALDGKRDRARGRVVFDKQCANCHRVGDFGHAVGPDLGTITSKPDDAILSEILDPNSRIDPEYRSYTVVTHDGRSFTGLLVSDSATSIVLKKEKAETQSILRRDIAELVASEVSLMPADFHQTMTPQDVAHLLSYLRDALTKK